jgi:hypothetical protein
MAFKKTQGRQVYVSPVGMPDLSGFSEVARQYERLSNFAMTVGTDIQHRKFNQAIVEAEAEGRTNGVKYVIDPETKEKKLAPLVNLSYAQSNEFGTESERQAIQNVYRKAAVASYASAKVNDINDQAQKSFLRNEANPDGVQADYAGYLEGLEKSVEPEVFAQLAPKAEAAFLSASNKALANLQIQVNAESKQNLSTQFTTNFQELGKLLAVGSGAEEGSDEYELYSERVQEIMSENAEILENIQQFNATPKEIDTLQTAQSMHIAKAIAESFIEKVYMENGSYSQALSSIDQIAEEINDPRVNTEALRKTLKARAFELHTIDQETDKEEAEFRAEINQEITRLRLAGISVSSMLDNPNHIIHNLQPTQVEYQLNQSEASFDKANKEAYDAQFQFLDNWQQAIGQPEEDNLFKNFSEIARMYDQGLVDFDLFSAAKGKIREYIDAVFVSPDANRRGFMIERELSNLSSYTVHPQVFIDQMPDLIKLNVIGKDRTFESESAYLNAVESYSTKFGTRSRERIEAQVNIGKALQGIHLSDPEILNVRNNFPQYKAILPDGSVLEPSFVTEDENLLQASMDAADRFAIETNGLLFPEVKEMMSGAYKNPVLLDTMLRTMGQIVTGMQREYGGDRSQHFYDLLETNNFSDAEQSFLLDALATSPELAIEANKGLTGAQAVNVDRLIKNYLGSNLEGELTSDASDRFVQEVFTEAMTGFNFYKMLNPKISEKDQAMLDELALSTGIKSRELRKATIGNERTFNVLKGIFYSKLANSRGAGNPKQAMRQAMLKLGKRFGFQKNTVTGEIELIERPIMHYAQASVPTRRTLSGRKVPVAILTEPMVREDVVRKWLGSDTPNVPRLADPELDKRVKAALDPENGYGSDINFYANDNFGGKQTYKVVLTDHYENPTVLYEEYSFDWNTSVHSKRFKQVLENIQTDRMKRFWSSYGLLDQSLINSGLKGYNSRAIQASGLQDIVSNLDYLRLLTSPGATPEFLDSLGKPFTTQELEDFYYIFDQIGSLGYR